MGYSCANPCSGEFGPQCQGKNVVIVKKKKKYIYIHIYIYIYIYIYIGLLLCWSIVLLVITDNSFVFRT